MEAASGARAILTGAFVNAGILAEKLADGAYDGPEVVVVGCGWEGRRASEDEAAAGAILHRLRSRGPELEGRASRVVEGYLSRPVRALRNNSVARRLKRLGYEDDLDKKERFHLDKGMVRHYPGVSEGGSNVTSSVESATGRR